MAIVTTDDKYYKDIADRLRGLSLNSSSQNAQYKPSEMADGLESLALEYASLGDTNGYERGKEEGIAIGIEQGITEGKEEAYDEIESLNTELEISLYGGDTGYRGYYDEFWDVHQKNGTQENYSAFFAGRTWTAETLRPKYNIAPTNAYQMFYVCGADGDTIDLVEVLKECGVTLDFSKATNINNTFQSANISHVGIVDATSAPASITALFTGSNIETIEKLIIKADGSQSFGNSFTNCGKLKNITIEGTIGQNIDFKDCSKLTASSIDSVILHLSDTASGKTVTFNGTAVVNAFGGTDSTEWTTLIGTKKNWTINLI